MLDFLIKKMKNCGLLFLFNGLFCINFLLFSTKWILYKSTNNMDHLKTQSMILKKLKHYKKTHVGKEKEKSMGLHKVQSKASESNCEWNEQYKWIEIVKKGIETLLKTQTSSSAAKQIYVIKNVAEITPIYRRWCLTFSGIGLKFQVW